VRVGFEPKLHRHSLGFVLNFHKWRWKPRRFCMTAGRVSKFALLDHVEWNDPKGQKKLWKKIKMLWRTLVTAKWCYYLPRRDTTKNKRTEIFVSCLNTILISCARCACENVHVAYAFYFMKRHFLPELIYNFCEKYCTTNRIVLWWCRRRVSKLRSAGQIRPAKPFSSCRKDILPMMKN